MKSRGFGANEIASISLLVIAGCAEGSNSFELLDGGDAIESEFAGAGAFVDSPQSALVANFEVDIAIVGDEVQLGWMPQGDAVDYTVWHGDEAYWQPGEAGTTMLFTGASTSFAHAVAGDGNHHYYQVVAHTTSGDDLSATVGKFSHQLHPGFNKVPQPLDTGVTDAQAFASMHGDYLQSVHLFDETLQDFRTWYAGYGEPPFGLGLGQVPIVSADWQAEEMVYEEVGRVPAEDELQIPLLAGMNLVTVPLSMGDTTASAVLALVPGAWRVGQWHSNGQYREWHEEGAPDFPVEAGEDIYVDTTVESMWPPPPPSPPPSHEGVNPLDGMGAVQPVATGFQFTEGPLWLASEGALLFTDLAGDQIWRYEPGVGTSLVRDVSGRFTNGMTFDINGDRIECQHATQQVVRVEADGSETTLATEWNGVTLNSPNDVVVGPDGSLYFADATVGAFAHLGNVQNMPLGFQGLYRIDPEGVLHLIDDIFADPTGMGISPQGDMLYVSDWGTGLVHSYPINPDGSVGPGSVLTDLTPQPDGMCLDMEGNIYVTTNQGLHIMEPDGTPWGLLVLPETPASNCAFGGPERTTLYITDFTGVYAVDVTIPGAPPFGG